MSSIRKVSKYPCVARWYPCCFKSGCRPWRRRRQGPWRRQRRQRRRPRQGRRQERQGHQQRKGRRQRRQGQAFWGAVIRHVSPITESGRPPGQAAADPEPQHVQGAAPPPSSGGAPSELSSERPDAHETTLRCEATSTHASAAHARAQTESGRSGGRSTRAAAKRQGDSSPRNALGPHTRAST